VFNKSVIDDVLAYDSEDPESQFPGFLLADLPSQNGNTNHLPAFENAENTAGNTSAQRSAEPSLERINDDIDISQDDLTNQIFNQGPTRGTGGEFLHQNISTLTYLPGGVTDRRGR